MDLAALSRLDIKDLKSVDYRKLWGRLCAHPQHFMTAGLILVTVVTGVYVFLQRRADLNEVLQKIKVLEKKVVAFDEYQQTKSEFEQLLADLPPGYDDNELSKQMTNMAIAAGVRIESFTPINMVDLDSYRQAGIRMDVSAEKYTDIWQFIYDIETSAYALRVDSWTGTTSDDPMAAARRRLNISDNSPRMIRASMEISSLVFKKDK